MLPRIETSLPGPRAQAIIARDNRLLSPSYTRAYPLVVARGHGAIIEDVDGNSFLDFTAGIAVCSTGHAHPKVVQAIQEQAARFLHMSGTDFYYESMVELAEKLAKLAPGAVKRRVYYGNSGAEGVEAAMKMARHYTGRKQFIAFYGSFHGRTMGALSLTASREVQKRGFAPFIPGVHHVRYPNPYRSITAEECIDYIRDVLFRHVLSPEEVAGIFVEPIQGEGGYIVPPSTFLRDLQILARQHGILLICDEVQCGMGRTGAMFASEHFGIEPDVLILAKGIASGLPLSAVVARAEIMNWGPGAHASTFGGNPVSIAASLATIQLLENELISNAKSMGQHMLDRMRQWPEAFGIVGDVRGLGLMLAVEIVKDRRTKVADPETRDRIEQFAFERGLLVLGAGPNSIRLCPPLIINESQADYALDVLEDCLMAVTQMKVALAARA